MAGRFKKPAWLTQSLSKPSTQIAKSEQELFQRSGSSLDEFLKAQELREQKHGKDSHRAKAATRSNSEISDEGAYDVQGRYVKRRRISQEEETAVRTKSQCPTPSVLSPNIPQEELIDEETKPQKGESEQSRPINVTNNHVSKDVIEILDDEETTFIGEFSTVSPRRNKDRGSRGSKSIHSNKTKVTQIEDEKIIEEDDIFAAAEAHARARAAERKRKEQMQLKQSLPVSGVAVAIPSNKSTAAIDERSIEADPVISIFIHPAIPGTQPLLVKLRYRQRLREMREAWCARQAQWPMGMRPDDVIFAYCNKHVLDWSTIKTLGVRLNEFGEPILRRGTDGIDESGDKIVIVATTHALLNQAKAEDTELRNNKATSTLAGELEDQTPTEERVEASQPKELNGIRIVLRAKNFAEQKLIVRHDTSFERIARAFKKQQKLQPNAHVVLRFDGDELGSSQIISDSEIEDLDVIEVLVKN